MKTAINKEQYSLKGELSKYKGMASKLNPDMVKDDPRAKRAFPEAVFNAVIYARVSSTGDRQDTKRQVEDLRRYAETAGLNIVAVYEEKGKFSNLSTVIRRGDCPGTMMPDR